MPARLIGPELERQLRNWEIAQQQGRDRPKRDPPKAHEFVTISRMFGSGGREVAQELSRRLGWPVFDREILHAMAGENAYRERIYATLDERDASWVESVMHLLIEGEPQPHDYFPRLARTVLALARGGHAIYLGRGADLILPDDRGLRVRIVAPHNQCVEGVAAREELDVPAAERLVQKVERERSDFIRRHLHRDVAEPSRYDVVINMARFSVSDAAALIEAAMRVRRLTEPASA